jgi:uncharacterized phage protein (TIGR01671 family)
MNMDRIKYRYWEHEVWNDPKTPLVPKYTNIVDGCDPTVAVSDFEFCTGLKDKNGNLIYEGDIIRFCLNTRGYVLAYERAVVWDNESASFMIVSNLDQVKPRTKRQMPNIKTHNIEIVGNIHEQKDNK